MFAFSKGNRRKWVNRLVMHCRVCYDMDSLDEQKQVQCQCVSDMGNVWGGFLLLLLDCVVFECVHVLVV